MNEHDTPTEHDDRSLACARSILAMIGDARVTEKILIGALRLAYSTGARDQQHQQVVALARRGGDR